MSQKELELPQTIDTISIKGMRVLVRVDFNVPIENGHILDDTRIKMAIPTIQYLQKNGASRIILMSHLGRPEGRDTSLSLKPISIRLSELMKTPALFIPDCVGPKVEDAIQKAPDGSIIVLENLRFYEAEEKPKKDPLFAKNLSELGDIYINDAFGTAHRGHSSTAVIASFFPKDKRAIGFLMEQEIESLGTHLFHPNRPFSAIIGGAKISTKIGVLRSLLDTVDTLFIGGAMSYTFFKAQGISIGTSLVEPDMIDTAREIESYAKKKNIPLYLPLDIVVTKKIEKNASFETVMIHEGGIPDGYEGVDIGPKTIAAWTPLLQKSKTVFWNGPLGVFEVEPFDKGTCAIAKILAAMKDQAFTVVGGGDSVSALQKLNLTSSISHVSSGGGASLEFIEQRDLPGIQALR